MAATRIMSIHVNKGKTIAQTITDRTDYAENPDKTRKGELVTGFGCDPHTVDTEFLLAKQEYLHITGRSQGARDVLAYHIRQSFKPGEISPEDANRIGYELAMRFTHGKHAFIVATHEDRLHIHNHIIFNSTTLDCTRKFFDFLGSGRAVRRISDRLCLENGLSIIENPKKKTTHYGKWLGDDKPMSWSEKLRQSIDTVLEEKPVDFAAFLQSMNAMGYEIKQGKHVAFKSLEQKRFTRLRSLGDDYSDDAIRERIDGKRIVVSKRKIVPPIAPTTTIATIKTATMTETPKFTLLIQLQSCVKAKDSPGYANWVKVFNLKQLSQTFNYLDENNLLDLAELKEKSSQATAKFNELSSKIKIAESRMGEITSLQKHIGSYSKTREVYAEYKKAGYSKKFLATHESEIILHQAAKKHFDTLGLKKLPTIKTLQTEYATLASEKKKLYQSYRQSKEEMQNLLTVKANAEQLLNYGKPLTDKENQRSQR